ncbi:MAG: hypothetical protein COB29_13305 [Sulfitobacter sp.]|nr:MAG: hypothetical protein COB29_13305 [Sulfitobacter sp.]
MPDAGLAETRQDRINSAEWDNHFGDDHIAMALTWIVLTGAKQAIASQEFDTSKAAGIQECIDDILHDAISDVEGTLTQLLEATP